MNSFDLRLSIRWNHQKCSLFSPVSQFIHSTFDSQRIIVSSCANLLALVYDWNLCLSHLIIWKKHLSHPLYIDLLKWSYLPQHLVQRLVTGPDCGASMPIHPINAIKLCKKGEFPITNQPMACTFINIYVI